MDVVRPFDAQTVYMGRIPYGADIIETLEAFCTQHAIHSAWIQCLGAVSQVTLAYYDQETHQYHPRVFQGGLEILNATGNVSLKEGKPFIHLHMTVSDHTFECMGGHVVRGGTQVFSCEFTVWVLAGTPWERPRPDPQTGLPLWYAEY